MSSQLLDDERTESVELELEGMTCASCAARIERKLNTLESVEASVNFATEEAYVRFDPASVQVEDLITAVASAGYGARPADHEHAGGHELSGMRLAPRLAAAIALGVPVLAIAMVPALQFSGWPWLALVLSIPVVGWAGWPFHRAAVVNLRHGAATMVTLVSLGTLSAFLWSAVVVVSGSGGHSYFEAAVAITALVLAGRYLEARAKRRSSAAIRALLELGAKQARVLRGDEEELIPIEQLRVGDLFVVRPGEKIASDGIVAEGSSAIDRSILTGESVPVDVTPGSEVIGGALNTYGRLVVRTTRIGEETALAQIARLVEQAQAGKAPVQRLVDRISAVFVPVAIGVSLATLAAWLAIGADAGEAFTAAVAVLVSACPCALGLATPAALTVGLGRGAQLGILIRGPEVLERTRGITAVLLDKTGTVTEGRMIVTDVVAAHGENERELLRLAGAAESASEHPIALALVTRAREHSGTLPSVESFVSSAGLGVGALVDGHRVVVGQPRFLSEEGLVPSDDLGSKIAEFEAAGKTIVVIGWDGAERGLVAVSDAAREGSSEAIQAFAELGLDAVLVSGDNENATRWLARSVGIEHVLAGVLPHEKAQAVSDLQRKGEVVAMVGDGVNDAPALAQADLGIAVASGTDVAIETSDITLVTPDLRLAVDAVRLARRTLRTIKENLFWAFVYNAAAIPIAAAGLLNPIIAAAAMSASSLLVVSNSLRLRRFRRSWS